MAGHGPVAVGDAARGVGVQLASGELLVERARRALVVPHRAKASKKVRRPQRGLTENHPAATLPRHFCKEDAVKIAVCLKQVPATDSQIRPSPDGRGVDLATVKMETNPYDEFALEEALRLKEKLGGEVVLLSIGAGKIEEAMRGELARGADKAVVLKDESYAGADALAVASALAALVRREAAEVVFCGKQAVDVDEMAVPAMLAERLDWPHASVVVKMEVAADGKSARVEREVEGGHEEMEIALPAVIGAQKGLNEPRYANLKGIMAAKKKPLEAVTAGDLGLEPPVRAVEVLGVAQPSTARKNRMIPGDAAAQAAELVRILREEEKLI
jgi:electron transfer flavoprotein beta subunit